MKDITFVIYAFVLITSNCSSEEKVKRILLSDIDVEQLLRDVQELKQTVNVLKQQRQTDTSGVVYTRWGRKTCPGNGTELVYEGFAGGGPYSEDGAAVNYVCLPHNPEFNDGDISMSPYGHTSTMYGAEYEDNYFGASLFQKDVPCAVCRATETTALMMIPGKKTCAAGWKREYYGRLAAGGDDGHGIVAASEYVCVDNTPDALEDGLANEDGKLFVPVKAICGTLRCPPYKPNAFLTCVVCTK